MPLNRVHHFAALGSLPVQWIVSLIALAVPLSVSDVQDDPRVVRQVRFPLSEAEREAVLDVERLDGSENRLKTGVHFAGATVLRPADDGSRLTLASVRVAGVGGPL